MQAKLATLKGEYQECSLVEKEKIMATRFVARLKLLKLLNTWEPRIVCREATHGGFLNAEATVPWLPKRPEATVKKVRGFGGVGHAAFAEGTLGSHPAFPQAALIFCKPSARHAPKGRAFGGVVSSEATPSRSFICTPFGASSEVTTSFRSCTADNPRSPGIQEFQNQPYSF